MGGVPEGDSSLVVEKSTFWGGEGIYKATAHICAQLGGGGQLSGAVEAAAEKPTTKARGLGGKGGGQNFPGYGWAVLVLLVLHAGVWHAGLGLLAFGKSTAPTASARVCACISWGMRAKAAGRAAVTVCARPAAGLAGIPLRGAADGGRYAALTCGWVGPQATHRVLHMQNSDCWCRGLITGRLGSTSPSPS